MRINGAQSQSGVVGKKKSCVRRDNEVGDGFSSSSDFAVVLTD